MSTQSRQPLMHDLTACMRDTSWCAVVNGGGAPVCSFEQVRIGTQYAVSFGRLPSAAWYPPPPHTRQPEPVVRSVVVDITRTTMCLCVRQHRR